MDKGLRKVRCLGDNEERKLELRLGPPGDDSSELMKKKENDQICYSVLSKDCYSSAPSAISPPRLSAGTKRGFFDNIEPKAEALQQQEQTDFLHYQTKQELEKEISQRTNARTDACCPPPPRVVTASGSEAMPHNRSQIRSSSTPVVGWPPIRSSRKNLASSSKQTVESQSGRLENAPKSGSIDKSLFVKINMEGIPIGRKIDLLAYDCYEKLSSAVDELFRDLYAAQIDPLNAIKKDVEKPAIKGLLDGSGKYTLIYEDDEGDRMLVGDVPWDMFVSTAKRLRVLKSSELASSSAMGAFSRKKKPV